MSTTSNDNFILCPECEAVVQFAGKPQVGKRIPCRRCNSLLVIRSTKPLHVGVIKKNSANHKKSAKAGKKKAGPANLFDEPETEAQRPPPPPSSSSTRSACPECRHPIELKNPPKLRQAIVCKNCEEVLQVVQIKPLALQVVDEDDWV